MGESVQLIFTLTEIPAKAGHKPTLIKLPHPLYTGAERSICVIVKDPQRKYKDLFATHPIPNLKQVVGVEKLKAKYRQYEARRQLCDSHDLFLCDSRVIEMMAQVLGKYFFQTKKKLPIPVKLDEKAKNPEAPFVEAINSTCLRTPSWPTCGVKIGRCDMTADELLANALTVLPVAFAHFAKQGNAIRQVHVQATDAPALPIYKAVAAAEPQAKKRPAVEEPDEELFAPAQTTTLGDLAKKKRKTKA